MLITNTTANDIGTHQAQPVMVHPPIPELDNGLDRVLEYELLGLYNTEETSRTTQAITHLTNEIN